jgi:hypothetical protein
VDGRALWENYVQSLQTIELARTAINAIPTPSLAAMINPAHPFWDLRLLSGVCCIGLSIMPPRHGGIAHATPVF